MFAAILNRDPRRAGAELPRHPCHAIAPTPDAAIDALREWYPHLLAYLGADVYTLQLGPERVHVVCHDGHTPLVVDDSTGEPVAAELRDHVPPAGRRSKR